MKFRSMLMCAGAIFTIAACHDSSVSVDKVNVNVTEPLSPERTDSVKVAISIEYPSSGLEDSVKTAICENIVEAAFGSDYAGLDLKSAADKWTADFVAEYRSTCMDLLKANAENDDINVSESLGFLVWSSNIDGYFSGKHEDVVSYTIADYVYEGGAHGSSSEVTVNMNLKTGKQVTEEDFFIPGYKEELSKLLTSHLRDAMPDQESYDCLFIKDIEPNGNFKVSDTGVTYVYGQYEIGPYSLGIIKVNVPWEELGDLVREHPLR